MPRVVRYKFLSHQIQRLLQDPRQTQKVWTSDTALKSLTGWCTFVLTAFWHVFPLNTCDLERYLFFHNKLTECDLFCFVSWPGANTTKVTVVPRMTHSVKLIDDSLGWCDAGMEVGFSKLVHIRHCRTPLLWVGVKVYHCVNFDRV